MIYRMEKKDLQVELGTKECFEEALPPVLKLVSSQTVAGFDCVGYANGKNDQSQTATNYTSQEETLVHEPVSYMYIYIFFVYIYFAFLIF